MFVKNKIHNIFINPKDENPFQTAIIVPESFSFWAFIFHFLWALYHKLWFLSGVIVAFFAVEVALLNFGIINVAISEITRIGFLIWLGFEASEWRCEAARNKGYILYDVVYAYDEISARQRFMDLNPLPSVGSL